MSKINASAKLFISVVVLAGLGTLGSGVLRWDCKDLYRFVSFLIITALASRLKLSLPGVNGTMSVNVPFLLVSIMSLSFGEAVVLAAASGLVQCLGSNGKRMRLVQVVFNVSAMVIAVGVTELVYRQASGTANLAQASLLIAVAGAAYFLADTLPVAVVIALTQRQNVVKVWHEIFRLTFPYFSLSATIAGVMVTATQAVGWQTPLFVIPVMVLTYYSYGKYFRESQALHAVAAD